MWQALTKHFNRINSSYIYINPVKKLPLLRVTHFTYEDYQYCTHFTCEEYLIYLIMTTYKALWIRNVRKVLENVIMLGFFPLSSSSNCTSPLCSDPYGRQTYMKYVSRFPWSLASHCFSTVSASKKFEAGRRVRSRSWSYISRLLSFGVPIGWLHLKTKVSAPVGFSSLWSPLGPWF